VAARHSHEFFCDLLDAAVADFCAAARVQRLALKNPPMTIEQFLAKLEEAGLPLTAARLRACADRL
jgi:hypothetical protein